MFNISLDVDYLNIYRKNQRLPLTEEKDLVITRGLERAANLLSDYDFKATFFLVGDSIKDYKPYFLKLIAAGHEIGNHTMGHFNLFELSPPEQENEILSCQQIIRQELNYQPVGFKAPGYSISEEIYRILSKYDIRYDTSPFTSVLLPIAKVLFYLRSGKSGFGGIKQLFQTAKIHKKGDLFIIPVGSTILKFPFYGSFHAMLPISANLRPPDFAFTYLMHPIEFLENNEVGAVKTNFRTTLSERVGIYRKIFQRLKRTKRRCVLLRDMVEELADQL